MYNNYVIGGYGSGHLRVHDYTDGSLVAEITAHARWINAISVNSNGLVSRGLIVIVRVERRGKRGG